VAAPKKQKSHEPVPEEQLQFIASRFKVLAEPMRLRILHSLQPGEQTVTRIIEITGASQANVSKHLAVLTRAEMVGRRKEGLNVFYSITDPVIFELCELVCDKLRTVLASRSARAVTDE
jgi:DNA-binding transcriptional ArsR family regulator